MGFQQILKKARFSHKQLRLHLAHLERQGQQEDQKHVYTSKLSPNQKTRIKTTLHQFRDKAAREKDSMSKEEDRNSTTLSE